MKTAADTGQIDDDVASRTTVRVSPRGETRGSADVISGDDCAARDATDELAPLRHEFTDGFIGDLPRWKLAGARRRIGTREGQ